MIVNLGILKMYGSPRTSSYNSRLKNVLNSGDKSFKVGSGLDWQVDDQISVLTNTMSHTHTEYFTIETYDSTTGLVTTTVAA